MEDDINHKIYKLISDISEKLIDTNESISKLKEESERLVPENELSNFLTTYQQNGVADHQVEDIEIMINQLENQRIQLVMDLQQQDYLRDKLQELITHNSEMVLSVKEYLENKPVLIKDDYNAINSRYKTYVNQLQSHMTKLQFNNYEMNKNFARIESLLKSIELDDIPKINELIQELNGQEAVN